MSKRRILPWSIAAVTLLALTALWLAVRPPGAPPLPVLAVRPDLPKPLSEALGKADAAARRAAPGESGPLRTLAQLYQANRLYPEARQCYRRIAAVPPGLTPRDLYLMAAIDLDESDLEGAKAKLEGVVRLQPDYVPARLALAAALFKSGAAEEAARQYAAVLSAEPDNPQASLGTARIELQRGDDAAAVARLRSLLVHHPESSLCAAVLAQVLDRQGDAEGASALRVLSQQSHDLLPPDPWLDPLLTACYDVQRLGIAFEQYRLSGQMDLGLPLLDRLEEVDPSSWIAPMLRGWSLNKAGDHAGAVRQYRLALGRKGDPEKICPLIGAALIKAGNLPEAASILADFHARMPRSIPILKSYCEVAVRSGDTVLARRLLGEALALDPYLYMANMSLVQILWTSGKRDEAAVCLQRVARVYPADIDSRGILGQYYLEKSDPHSAIPLLEQALSTLRLTRDRRADLIGSMLYTAYLVAGSLEATQGRFPQAVAFAGKATALKPSELRGYALAANASRRMHDYPAALSAMDTMARLKPDDPGMRLGLGDLAYASGDRERALAEWKRALDLSPADAGDLRDALRRRIDGTLVPKDP